MNPPATLTGKPAREVLDYIPFGATETLFSARTRYTRPGNRALGQRRMQDGGWRVIRIVSRAGPSFRVCLCSSSGIARRASSKWPFRFVALRPVTLSTYGHRIVFCHSRLFWFGAGTRLVPLVLVRLGLRAPALVAPRVEPILLVARKNPS